VDERRRHHHELAGHVEVQLPHQVQVSIVLARDGAMGCRGCRSSPVDEVERRSSGPRRGAGWILGASSGRTDSSLRDGDAFRRRRRRRRLAACPSRRSRSRVADLHAPRTSSQGGLGTSRAFFDPRAGCPHGVGALRELRAPGVDARQALEHVLASFACSRGSDPRERSPRRPLRVPAARRRVQVEDRALVRVAGSVRRLRAGSVIIGRASASPSPGRP